MTVIDRFNYPLLLNLHDRLVVIVGNGKVGRRKLAGVLRCDGRVRLVDPQLSSSPCLESAIEAVPRKFRPEDLLGAVLAFACTNSPEVNRQIAAEARQMGIFCCITDEPLTGDFALPAVLSRGQLTVAVGTGGASPGLAAIVRDQLAEQIPDSWGFAVEIVAAIRQMWLTGKIADKYNQEVLRSFWKDHLLPLMEQGNYSEIDRLLQETFGVEISLERLQLKLPEGAPWGP